MAYRNESDVVMPQCAIHDIKLNTPCIFVVCYVRCGRYPYIANKLYPRPRCPTDYVVSLPHRTAFGVCS